MFAQRHWNWMEKWLHYLIHVFIFQKDLKVIRINLDQTGSAEMNMPLVNMSNTMFISDIWRSAFPVPNHIVGKVRTLYLTQQAPKQCNTFQSGHTLFQCANSPACMSLAHSEKSRNPLCAAAKISFRSSLDLWTLAGQPIYHFRAYPCQALKRSQLPVRGKCAYMCQFASQSLRKVVLHYSFSRWYPTNLVLQ